MNWKLFNIIFIGSILFMNNAYSLNKKEKPVVIQGEKQALDVSDFPLNDYSYNSLSYFMNETNPEKEILSILDNPDLLIDIKNNEVDLNFDSDSNAGLKKER